MSLKKALLLCIPLAVVAIYALSGCIHGERDDTPLSIKTTSLPPGQAGQAYTYSLEAIGGKYPYTWSTEGSGSTLPPGVYLSETGNLTGTPTTDGSYAFTAVVTDADNDPRTSSRNFTIIVYPEDEVSITTAALTPAYINEAYEGQMNAVGGVTPYTWSIVSGATQLVPGLYLSESGLVSGTPTVEGITTVEVRVDDDDGDFDTRNVTITIYEPQEALAITTTSPLPDRSLGYVSDSYDPPGYQLSATGGAGGEVWAEETGSAPLLNAGLTLSANGILTKTGSPTTGEYSFSIKVTDSTGTVVSKVFKVEVIP